MRDPRIDPDFADITFRDRARRLPVRDNATSLFWTGVAIFVFVALVYPFYSYQVETRLVARDLETAVEEFSDEVDAAVTSVDRASAEAVQRATEADRQNRLRRISVVGSTIVSGQAVVIVDFGTATFTEVRETICRLAERRFRASLSGQQIRVQRHQGNEPARDVGTVRCD